MYDREYDGILFPLGKNVVWVASEEEALRLPEIAEAVYSLNAEAAPMSLPAEKQPGFVVVFAITGLLAVAYLIRRRKEMKG